MMILSWRDGHRGRIEFEKNVHATVRLVAEIFMTFVEKGEAVLQELKHGSKENTIKVLSREDLDLNPFEKIQSNGGKNDEI